MPATRLRAFVSSKMQELASERAITKAALDDLEVDAWVFEEDAGARPRSIEQTFLEEVQQADLYIGIFWKGFGEYTVEEFDHAVKLKKDCLVYEKRSEIDGERDPQLQKFLDRLAAVNTGITIRWFSTPQELGNFVKEDVARWQAENVRKAKIAGAPVFQSRQTPVEDLARRDLLILLKKVRQFWIEGVLENSVHNESVIALGKKRLADVVEHPWESVLELPDQSIQSISSTRSMADILDDASNFLLILGDPGSGKTISLLELARDLLNFSERDSVRPVPVIFNLSSWTNRNQSISDWIVSELKSEYQIPDKIGKAWVDGQRLLMLMDGLDEVKSNIQDDCIAAINRFIEEAPFGLVVCCRRTEYTALRGRLRLNAAVCIQPLNPEQIDAYLTNGGPQLAALRLAVKSDSGLQTLVQTPLMLSIMSLVYHGHSVTEPEEDADAAIETQQAKIFDAYIKQMFERKGKALPVYPKERVISWLGWLGRQMQTHSQTVFLIEELQPDSLETKAQYYAYLLSSRLAAGIVLSLGLGSAVLAGLLVGNKIISDDASGVFYLAIFILISCLITVVVDVARNKRAGKLDKTLSPFKSSFFDLSIYFIVTTALGSIILLLFAKTPGVGDVEGVGVFLEGMMLIAVTQWVVFSSFEGNGQAMRDIIVIEMLTWSGIRTIKAVLAGVGGLFALLLPVFVMFRLRFVLSFPELTFELLKGLASSAAMTALFLGVPIALMLGGFKSKLSTSKTLPNQGIKLTGRNALVSGLGLGILLGSFFGVMWWIVSRMGGGTVHIQEMIYVIINAAMVFAVLVGFRFGGYTVIKHYCLRAFLLCNGKIPIRYSLALNYATKLIFLRRVGGGYIFIHRLLLEHFASHISPSVGTTREVTICDLTQKSVHS